MGGLLSERLDWGASLNSKVPSLLASNMENILPPQSLWVVCSSHRQFFPPKIPKRLNLLIDSTEEQAHQSHHQYLEDPVFVFTSQIHKGFSTYRPLMRTWPIFSPMSSSFVAYPEISTERHLTFISSLKGKARFIGWFLGTEHSTVNMFCKGSQVGFTCKPTCCEHWWPGFQPLNSYERTDWLTHAGFWLSHA